LIINDNKAHIQLLDATFSSSEFIVEDEKYKKRWTQNWVKHFFWAILKHFFFKFQKSEILVWGFFELFQAKYFWKII